MAAIAYPWSWLPFYHKHKHETLLGIDIWNSFLISDVQREGYYLVDTLGVGVCYCCIFERKERLASYPRHNGGPKSPKLLPHHLPLYELRDRHLNNTYARHNESNLIRIFCRRWPKNRGRTPKICSQHQQKEPTKTERHLQGGKREANPSNTVLLRVSKLLEQFLKRRFWTLRRLHGA